MRQPRHYASEIADISDLIERRKALAKVPEDMREIVKTYLRLKWEWKKYNENRRK